MSDPTALVELDVDPATSYWWSNKLNGIRFNGRDEWAFQTETEDQYAFTDSGTSCLIAPAVEYNFIIEALLDVIKSTSNLSFDDDWGWTFNCRGNWDNMPIIEVLFGGYWFEILPEDYIIEI